jgi:DNA-binding LacI/PurR family transcriptional regulator
MTIVEIAKEAGVSIATVSRVLNNGSVSAKKRSLVEAVIEKHKFQPNLLARGLINRQSETIGLITHGISNHFNMDFIQVVERHCNDMGYLLFVCICESKDPPEMERLFLNDLIARQVNGIILHDSFSENYDSGFLSHIAKQIPLVIIHSFNSSQDINSVEVDQVLGMRKVMTHLIDLGHRDILFLRGPNAPVSSIATTQADRPSSRGPNSNSYDSKEEVWREALAAVGSPPPPESRIVIAKGNMEEGILETEERIDALFSSGRVPTAIFGCNDIMATGALNAARKHGIPVPERLSVVGHDNTILAASGRITSVDLKTQSVGHASIDLLLHAMSEEDKEPRRLIISPDLVIRNSTGPVASS